MCDYSEIEDITLSDGKTVREVNEAVRKEVERIYVEGWKIGIAIPFRDGNGNICLANPDGSEDIVEFNNENLRKRLNLHKSDVDFSKFILTSFTEKRHK